MDFISVSQRVQVNSAKLGEYVFVPYPREGSH